MSLRFLSDENIAASLVKSLRNKGYEVFDVKEEELFGMDDIEMFKKANEEERIILTHDKDFILLSEMFLSSSCGVVLIRYEDKSPDNILEKFIPVLETIKDKLKGSLIIVYDDFIKVEKFKEKD